MSVQIRCKIICDGCGDTIEGPIVQTTTYGMMGYWEAKKEAQDRGWVILARYGPHKHYCSKCADKALP